MATKTKTTMADQLLALLKASTPEERGEMAEVWRAFTKRASLIRAQTAISEKALRPGLIVEFTGRFGVTVTGTISKVNTKTVLVSNCSDGRRWRVAPGALKVR